MVQSDASALRDHVIVCGVGGIGTRIVEQLRTAVPVVVIDDAHGARSEANQWPDVRVVRLRRDLARTLEAAGIDSARAVVCVTGEDLLNLEIALLARDRRADVWVVTSLENNTVAKAVAVGNGPGAVLDIAELTAPAIAEAAVGRRATDLEIDGVRFVAATAEVTAAAPAGATLRTLYGDLAPVAVVRGADSSDVVACPGRDLRVAPGDSVTLVGPEDEIRRVDARVEAVTPRVRRPGRWSRIRGALVGVLSEFDPNMFRALAFMLTLVAFSSLLLWQSYRKPGMSLLDGLYFSVETIATVGYGDFSFIDQAAWLRMWAIGLMIAGITNVAVLMAFFTDLLISRRLGSSQGKRKVRTMAGHHVVVGLGTFGLCVVRELLRRGKRVVVVERDEHNRHLGELAPLRVPVIFGDATLAATLDAAGAIRAAGVAVVTSDDMVNIETAIALREVLGAPESGGHDIPVVMRVFDRSLRRTMSRRFAFQYAQSTEELASPWFVGAALGVQVAATFVIAERTFMVARMQIDPGSALTRVAMGELGGHTRVVALQRSEGHVVPRRAERFRAGDLAHVVGPVDDVIALAQRSRGAAQATSSFSSSARALPA